MTDEDLRTLLQQRVADVTTTDLSATAWRSGQRIRTRRRLGAVAGVTAGVLAVAGVAVAIGGQPATDSDPGPTISTPSVDEPDAVVQGASVFWGPDPAEEDELAAPEHDGVLPTVLDLAAEAPSVEDAPIGRATAAFAVYNGSWVDRVVLVSPDGYRTLGVPDRTDHGSRLLLSEDGTELNLAGDGTAMTYVFESGQWLGERVGDGAHPEVVPQVVEAEAFGPQKVDPSGSRTAQSYGFGSSVPAAPGSVEQPETVVVSPVLGPPTILAIDAPISSGRFKECCPVAGWLDDDTLVFESRSTEPKLLAWEVGTHDFALVSRIVGLASGESYVATFASLNDPDEQEAPTAAATEGADAVAQGAPVWWSPDLEQELALPWVDPDDSPLPRAIDAAADLPDVADEPIDRAVAAFMLDPLRPGRVTLLAADGALRTLDISGLDPLIDPAGNASAVATTNMLAPDGRHLVFVQRGHVMVYALESGEWSRIDTGAATTDHVTWSDDQTLYLPPGPSGGRGPLFDLAGEQVGTDDLAPPAKAFDIARAFDNAEGPWRANHAGDVAQSWGMGGPFLPVRDPETYLSGPAYLAVVGPAGTRALAFMTAVDDYRFLDAPRVAGWLDDDTVVYESVADDRDLLIAWDVGTRDFRRVAALTGSTTSSFADLQVG